MALGNWATLAVRLDGTVIDTVKVDWQKSVSGVLIEIYKNWIYVSDEAVPRRPNDSFNEPVVLEIRHGSLVYADWHIWACRGPQDGIYVAAWSGSEVSDQIGFVGCGVYGYDGDKRVGVLPSSADFLRSWLATMSDEMPDDVSKVVVPDVSVDQGGAYFARNIPKLLADPNFDLEKAR